MGHICFDDSDKLYYIVLLRGRRKTKLKKVNKTRRAYSCRFLFHFYFYYPRTVRSLRLVSARLLLEFFVVHFVKVFSPFPQSESTVSIKTEIRRIRL